MDYLGNMKILLPWTGAFRYTTFFTVYSRIAYTMLIHATRLFYFFFAFEFCCVQCELHALFIRCPLTIDVHSLVLIFTFTSPYNYVGPSITSDVTVISTYLSSAESAELNEVLVQWEHEVRSTIHQGFPQSMLARRCAAPR